MSEDDLGEGWRQAAIDFRAERDKREKGSKTPKRAPPPGGWPSWRDKLLADERKRPYANLANVLIALHNDERLYHAAIFNEMTQSSIVRTVWPAAPETDPVQPPPRDVNDDDVGRLQDWLQWMGLPRIGRDTVGQAVEMFAREHRFHPIRDWLDCLRWDGVRRLDHWLFAYLGAKAETSDERDYVAAIGKMFLIAMVNRIYQPGCQCDYMLVLEGEQGALKSSACRILAGDEFFSDSLPERITSKDAKQHLRGKWLIEVSELAAFSKADVEALKAYITRRTENYRPPYGKHEVMEPRRCVFIGTTNQDTYIKDTTGGRRFWPVLCLDINLDRLSEDRDQLFAEAVARRAERHWPTRAEEERFFKPQQDSRREEHPWFPLLEMKVAECLPSDKWTTSDVARNWLGIIDNARIGTAEARTIASILKELGCTQKHTEHGTFFYPQKRADRS